MAFVAVKLLGSLGLGLLNSSYFSLIKHTGTQIYLLCKSSLFSNLIKYKVDNESEKYSCVEY